MVRDETNEPPGAGATESGGLTVVAVPEEKAQAVLEFVASLGSGTEDVSGHMISQGLIGGMGGPLSATQHNTMTGCWKTHVMGGDTDYSCSDSDR